MKIESALKKSLNAYAIVSVELSVHFLSHLISINFLSDQTWIISKFILCSVRINFGFTLCR